MYQRSRTENQCTKLCAKIWSFASSHSSLLQHCFLSCSGYYSQFMRNIHQVFDGRATVSSVASLGFHTVDSPLHKQTRTYNLREQCAHKAAYLLQHVIPSHSLPVVVMGHSIGLYIAMQAVHMCEGTRDSYSRQNTAGPPLPKEVSADRIGFFKDGSPR